MVLSKRERYFVIGGGIIVVGLALYQFALDPAMTAIQAAQKQKGRLESQLAANKRLLAERDKVGPLWQEWMRTGIKDKPEDAEGQAYNALGQWARESGVGLILLRGERLTEKSQIPQAAFQFTGQGTMSSIRNFLVRIQKGMLPLRITDLQLSSRKDGLDDLSFTLRMSTIYLPGARTPTTQSAPAPASAAASAPSRPAAPARGYR
jgi:hypothetical protein